MRHECFRLRSPLRYYSEQYLYVASWVFPELFGRLNHSHGLSSRRRCFALVVNTRFRVLAKFISSHIKGIPELRNSLKQL